MEQNSERLDPRSDAEAQIHVPGDAGTAGEATAEGRSAAVAPEADSEAAQDAVAWDAGEDADAVAWDADGALDPVGPGERPATGEPRVDAALARLDELAGRPVTEHRAIFDDVHRRLRDVLGELDTREQNSGDQAAAERRADR